MLLPLVDQTANAPADARAVARRVVQAKDVEPGTVVHGFVHDAVLMRNTMGMRIIPGTGRWELTWYPPRRPDPTRATRATRAGGGARDA